MATLEHILYIAHRPEVSDGKIKWVPDTIVRTVDRLPQVFWKDGKAWREANLWALEMARNRNVKLSTAISVMEHLHKYAEWLEETDIDWRHFPITKVERVLVRYRGALIDARDRGNLMPSTTTARMNAVIRFYRYAAGRNFISREAPKWQDRIVTISYFDPVGFERTMSRVTTDVSIPNRARPGRRLEDGLLPISDQDKLDLLQFASTNASRELCLMLMVGFYTGARIGTILTLRTTALDNAMPDPKLPNMWLLPVGPGTGIDTKFDINGNLMIPQQLMTMLRNYATSRRHLDRVVRANGADKSLLFLTRFCKQYKVVAVAREMVDLRRAGQIVGLKFLQKFKFHQTRATYGTWLITLCLMCMEVKAAIEFVKHAMFHKHESTTFGYITFAQNTKEKIELDKLFTEAFLGLSDHLKSAKGA
ncbi:tyrosine-type recombinase/integrase [Undibacterium pigrum]|uniref:Phage integrase family protein n=1 Tax=Undibacterium pigrum TaxID=401470 RepID=A0A318JDC2_9BURK|nr:tyrosine-type recombinase/integrase [Undibacterium pigrum]PXX46931.1 phage integrase family protein [Undibacterium pigrum]